MVLFDLSFDFKLIDLRSFGVPFKMDISVVRAHSGNICSFSKSSNPWDYIRALLKASKRPLGLQKTLECFEVETFVIGHDNIKSILVIIDFSPDLNVLW